MMGRQAVLMAVAGICGLLAGLLVAMAGYGAEQHFFVKVPAGIRSVQLRLALAPGAYLEDIGSGSVQRMNNNWLLSATDLDEGSSRYLAAFSRLRGDGDTGRYIIYLMTMAPEALSSMTLEPTAESPEPTRREYNLSLPPPQDQPSSQIALGLYHNQQVHLFDLVHYPFATVEEHTLLWQKHCRFQAGQQYGPIRGDTSLVLSGTVYVPAEGGLSVYHFGQRLKVDVDNPRELESGSRVHLKLSESLRQSLQSVAALQPHANGEIRLKPAKKLVVFAYPEALFRQDSRLPLWQQLSSALLLVDPSKRPSADTLRAIDSIAKDEQGWLINLQLREATPAMLHESLRQWAGRSINLKTVPLNTGNNSQAMRNLERQRELLLLHSFLLNGAGPASEPSRTAYSATRPPSSGRHSLSQFFRHGHNHGHSQSHGSGPQRSAAARQMTPGEGTLLAESMARPPLPIREVAPASAASPSGTPVSVRAPVSKSMNMANREFWSNRKGGGSGAVECPICQGEVEGCVSTQCGHAFCFNCLKSHALGEQNRTGSKLCPLCRAEVTGITPFYPIAASRTSSIHCPPESAEAKKPSLHQSSSSHQPPPPPAKAEKKSRCSIM